MTRVYDAKGNATPVTVIEAGGNTVVQLKSPETDGYTAVQVGFDSQKESPWQKFLIGHFKKATRSKKFVREFRLPDGTKVDGDLNVGVNQFQPGEFVDVIGRSKGKGFQGVVKKHGFAGQVAPRFENASPQRGSRQSLYTRTDLEKYGYARQWATIGSLSRTCGSLSTPKKTLFWFVEPFPGRTEAMWWCDPL